MIERIPEGWESKRLGDFIKLQGGNAFKSSNFKDSGIPIVRISNIRNNKIDLSDVIFYEKSKVFENFLVSSGDILLAMSGATTGKIGRYLLPFQSYLNQRVGRFQRIKNKSVCMDFIYQLVRSRIFIENTLKDAIGGAQPNISSTQVEGVFYKIPPIPEQKKIASILTSADNVIEKTQSQIEKLQDLKKGMMNELLTKGIGHTEFKDSELGRIPKSWSVKRLSEVTTQTKGLTYKSDDYGDENNGLPFLTLKSISKSGGYSPVGLKFYKGDFKPHHLIESGNILFANTDLTRDGDVVGSPLYFDSFEFQTKPLYSMDLSKLVVNPSQSDGRFLYYLLMTDRIKRFMINASAGSTVLHLDTKSVKSLLISLPPLREQKKIASILFSMDEIIEKKKHKIFQTQSLKKSLMQDLLTGKVRVKVN